MTQVEIARKLGVSQAAVSLVVNDPETRSISQKQRARIIECLNEKNYSSKRTKNYCMVAPQTMRRHKNNSSPWMNFSERFFYGALKKCNDLGKGLNIIDKGINSITSADYVKNSGFIILDEKVDLKQVKTLSGKTPVVLLNHELDELICDVVMPDDFGGVSSAISYLAGKGHKKIGYFMLKHPDSNMKLNLHFYNRMDGFRRGMRNNGINLDNNYLKVFTAYEKTPAEIGLFAERAISDWLKIGLPTAVFTQDSYAAHFIKAARLMGLDLPSDISIFGYDNNELLCESLNPRLTSVDQHMHEMASTAVNLLSERVNGLKGRPRRVVISTELFERDSVKEINSAGEKPGERR